jgi:hypothetical protein
LVKDLDRTPPKLDQTTRLEFVERRSHCLAVGGDHVGQFLVADMYGLVV